MKIEDLKVEPNGAFRRLRKLADVVFTVEPKEIKGKTVKSRRGKWKRPLAGARS